MVQSIIVLCGVASDLTPKTEVFVEQSKEVLNRSIRFRLEHFKEKRKMLKETEKEKRMERKEERRMLRDAKREEELLPFAGAEPIPRDIFAKHKLQSCQKSHKFSQVLKTSKAKKVVTRKVFEKKMARLQNRALPSVPGGEGLSDEFLGWKNIAEEPEEGRHYTDIQKTDK